MKCELCGNRASTEIIARDWREGQLLESKSIPVCSSCEGKFDSIDDPSKFYDFLGISENYDELDRKPIGAEKAPEARTSKQSLAKELVNLVSNLSDEDYAVLKRLNESQLDAIVNALKQARRT